jgi:hypothetical protein
VDILTIARFGQAKGVRLRERLGLGLPLLLAMLDLSGAVVIIAAMGCQKAVSAQIIGQRGN